MGGPTCDPHAQHEENAVATQAGVWSTNNQEKTPVQS